MFFGNGLCFEPQNNKKTLFEMLKTTYFLLVFIVSRSLNYINPNFTTYIYIYIILLNVQ